ncbi:MAG: DUF5686 and carboxypeptidase regulatory-like domain-containing protein [candidate division Zixibacteria bacterium]|nr:DUF5686 and carboxypeptidase regulatory-like domain-containing protein [candidate division Zixibacteria bacterium]
MSRGLMDRVIIFNATLILFTLHFAVPVFSQPRSLQPITPIQRATIAGLITDFDSGQPIPFATVQVEGTGQSTIANESGRFQMLVEPNGTYRLKCSHIAYFSERHSVAIAYASVQQDFQLRSALLELPGTRVYDRMVNPAEEIILEAIARKKDILSKLHDYSYDAYTKLVVRDRKKPDSANILLITETQVTSYWEQPDKYKEVITARKQTKNLKADNNLVTVGQILNFNKNRIDAGEMSIVSPTATDALDFYTYYLADTTFIDSQRVFILAIEPKTDLQTLFEGTIHIVDSTFDVVAVDVGFRGMQSAFLRNPRYSQRFAQFQSEYWMPVEIRFSGEFKLPVPIPGIPSDLSFAHVASLYQFRIEEGIPGRTFGEVTLEVADEADSYDSATWASRQTIPLSENEIDGYQRVDSIAAAPKPIGKQIARALIAIPFIAATKDDLFHFNRAEGAYLGLGASTRSLIPLTTLSGRAGYAFDAEYWQYKVGAEIEPLRHWPLSISAEYHDQMQHRPTVFHGSESNMTLAALWSQSDPLDYYRERGFSAGVRTKLLDKTRLGIGVSSLKQESTPLESDFSIFDPTDSIRINPAIDDGALRAIYAEFTYDSRSRYKRKGRVRIAGEPIYTQLTARVEHSSPDLFDSDADFTRYSISAYRRQRTLGLGVTSIFAYFGESNKPLPPQRYFTLEYSPLDVYQGRGLQTLGLNNFAGDQVAAISLRHEFKRTLFARSGIPGIKRLPFHVSFHGGVFWTDFKHQPAPDSVYGRIARRPYSELGFSIGNLTPFIAPFNLTLGFNWQLSAYDTHKFAMSWGFEF